MLNAQRIAEKLGGATVLGRDVRSANDLRAAVLDGLPKAALASIARTVAPDRQSQRALLHRVVPEATFKRRRERLSLVESERTERLARIMALAEEVLGNASDARLFLETPHPMLGGETPLAVILTDLGARQVEDILRGIEYGFPA